MNPELFIRKFQNLGLLVKQIKGILISLQHKEFPPNYVQSENKTLPAQNEIRHLVL
jgi:hypothetical protein